MAFLLLLRTFPLRTRTELTVAAPGRAGARIVRLRRAGNLVLRTPGAGSVSLAAPLGSRAKIQGWKAFGSFHHDSRDYLEEETQCLLGHHYGRRPAVIAGGSAHKACARLSVPDTRSPAFAEKTRRQWQRTVATDRAANEMDWIEFISLFDEDDAR